MITGLLFLASVGTFLSLCSAANVLMKTDTKPTPELLGTWKLVQAKYGGKEAVMPRGHIEYKHVTPVHYMLASTNDGNLVAAWGGPYTVKGDKYEETAEYGMSEIFTNIKGKPHTFTWKVVGNKWFHSGTVENGFTIEEVWERVEKQ